jgi:hypothetical protein
MVASHPYNISKSFRLFGFLFLKNYIIPQKIAIPLNFRGMTIIRPCVQSNKKIAIPFKGDIPHTKRDQFNLFPTLNAFN